MAIEDGNLGNTGRSRRSFLLGLSSVGVAAALGGCSSGDGQQTTDPEPTAGEQPTPDDEQPTPGSETPTEPPADSDPYFEVGPTVGVETVATGLVSPSALVTADDGTDRRFIADQTGVVYVHDDDGLAAEPFLDIRDRLVAIGEGLPSWVSYDERGLLGLAFHPEFAENGRFYVRYSAPTSVTDIDHNERLSEFTVAEDGTADPDSERILLELEWHRPIHQAGSIEFGPDGYLYGALGDGLNPYNGQDISNLMGSIVRIDVDGRTGDRPYGIPEDNPLVGAEGLDELYAWGFRNPWKMAFSGDQLIVGDVGQADWEEVNVVERGGNYGWPLKEGTYCHDPQLGTSSEGECVVSGSRGEELINPVLEFPHFYEDQPVGYAVIGGHIHGGAVDELADQYVFGVFTRSFTEPAGRLLVAQPGEDRPWRTSVLRFADREELGIQVLSLGQDGEDTYVLGTRAPLAEDPLSKNEGVVLRLTEA
jgi:glucose/arabinose dehydrogenase